ncbi:hypothetical protein B0H10DRAFT_2223993 [Mycena sp. CBHHK59/15]|nr:hypothetical protein B0H10DRAFT_2223993 [Mycena sp. CBHHK59/15]
MTFHHETLPTELWLEIFDHLDSRPYAISHAPFQPIPGVGSEGSVSSAYTSVVRVCRNWRAWAVGLLYRNVKLSEGVKIRQVIDRHQIYGRWVRRAIVPYSTTVTESCKPMPSTQILGLCPNLEVLVRPPYAPTPLRNLRFDFDATCLADGGINSLTAVLSAAPNLEYLFIGGGISGFTPGFHGLSSQTDLPNLRTLRLNIANAMLLRHIMHRWALPALSNLVVDSPMAGIGMGMIWEALGRQLRVVDCPALEEINYYVFITTPPDIVPDVVYPSVTTIGIHASENHFLGNAEDGWVHLERHFAVFASGIFPKLQRLRLFGTLEWPSILADSRFSAMHQRLKDQGCRLELPDGTLL